MESQEASIILWSIFMVLGFFYLYGCVSPSNGPIIIEDIQQSLADLNGLSQSVADALYIKKAGDNVPGDFNFTGDSNYGGEGSITVFELLPEFISGEGTCFTFVPGGSPFNFSPSMCLVSPGAGIQFKTGSSIFGPYSVYTLYPDGNFLWTSVKGLFLLGSMQYSWPVLDVDNTVNATYIAAGSDFTPSTPLHAKTTSHTYATIETTHASRDATTRYTDGTNIYQCGLEGTSDIYGCTYGTNFSEASLFLTMAKNGDINAQKPLVIEQDINVLKQINFAFGDFIDYNIQANAYLFYIGNNCINEVNATSFGGLCWNDGKSA